MPAFSASAPGKIILFGEHAVVYGRPAIAVPIEKVRAKTIVRANPQGESGSIHIKAPQIQLDDDLRALSQDHPIGSVVRDVFKEMDIEHPPAMHIRITSSIPMAAGMGSGAAVSISLARALSDFLGSPLSDETVSAIAFAAEIIHHGTPSGIDNTVITYQKPVYYVKDRPLQTFTVKEPFTIVIGDTGSPSPTAGAVGHVRKGWEANPEKYERIFAEIEEIVEAAHAAIRDGEVDTLGELMDANHACLIKLGVSSDELNHLIDTARGSGALGAKLSGAGWGGNMIALTPKGNGETIAQALREAGAKHTITTTIGRE